MPSRCSCLDFLFLIFGFFGFNLCLLARGTFCGNVFFLFIFGFSLELLELLMTAPVLILHCDVHHFLALAITPLYPQAEAVQGIQLAFNLKVSVSCLDIPLTSASGIKY